MRATYETTVSQTWTHFEHQAVINATPATLFAHLDDHSRLSSHMEKPSWRTLGAYMRIRTDAGKGQQLGSKLSLEGSLLGIRLYVEEEITAQNAPTEKRWRTIGSPKLLVIGHYQMGFSISPHAQGALLRVFIDYALCEAGLSRWLSRLLAPSYARWCTRKMVSDAQRHFASKAP